jgi:ketosteroid isomerase-like protein
MKKLAIIITVVAAILGCSDKRLTEAEVRAVMGNVETSVQRHDADRLMANFAPNALIMVSMPGTGGGLSRMSVGEYKAMLEGLWKVQLQSTYEVSNREVSLSVNGRSATARDVAKEVVLLPGERMESLSKQKAEIALVDGVPRIVALTAEVESLVATPTGGNLGSK